MSTDQLEQPAESIETVPASQQSVVESPEVDARFGWMKVAHEEVEILRHSQLLAQDKEWVYSDVSIDDKMQMKLLQDAGYEPDYENPGNSEKNRIMFYKKKREAHEMPYKAEVKKRELNERRMLKHRGSRDEKNAIIEPKIGQETFDEAKSRMSDTDEDFSGYEKSIMTQFNKLIKDE